jgi:hypothetical protein
MWTSLKSIFFVFTLNWYLFAFYVPRCDVLTNFGDVNIFFLQGFPSYNILLGVNVIITFIKVYVNISIKQKHFRFEAVSRHLHSLLF